MTTQASWIKHVQKTLSAQKGSFAAQDAQGASLIFEWELVTGKSARLNEVIRDVSDILVAEYARMELEFARAYPNEIGSQMFLKPLAPFFKDGVEQVDWQKAEGMLKENLSSFFLKTDFAAHATGDDLYLFVVAKEQTTGNQLGVIQFCITPDFEFGTVKIAFFCIEQEADNRGIEKMLVDSLFKLVPDTQKIFLHTRATNTKYLALYTEWGFAQVPETAPFWANLEYRGRNL